MRGKNKEAILAEHSYSRPAGAWSMNEGRENGWGARSLEQLLEGAHGFVRQKPLELRLWIGLRAMGGAQGCGGVLWAGLRAVGGALEVSLGFPSGTHGTASSRSSPGGRETVCLTCPGPLLGQGPQDWNPEWHCEGGGVIVGNQEWKCRLSRPEQGVGYRLRCPESVNNYQKKKQNVLSSKHVEILPPQKKNKNKKQTWIRKENTTAITDYVKNNYNEKK